VLAVHGHGPGKSRICELDPEAAPGSDYAAELARRGHVVLAPDLRCFGERADWNPEDHYACDTNLVHQVMAGWNPLTQNLWDLGRALDLLEDHPLVDPTRLGVAGFSYGGTMSLFLAATDPRISAAVLSGYFSSLAESHKVPWNMCGSQVLFGMLGHMEHADLGALVAPRPLLVESGRDDLLFPVAEAAASLARIRPLYHRHGADDRLVHDPFDGEHQWHGERAYPFLDRWLGTDPSEGPS
jgi:dienelactone hydrolase